MAGTSGVDVLVVAFNALSAEEQEEAAERIRDLRLLRLAGEESETGRMLRSLVRVRDHDRDALPVLVA